MIASEIDLHARNAYEAHWETQEDTADRSTDPSSMPDHLMIGDITSIYASQLPPFDILTAGGPSQVSALQPSVCSLSWCGHTRIRLRILDF